MDFGGGEEALFERRGAAGVITLARPKALNALTYPMVKAISAALSGWKADPAVSTVVIRGEGRAFCAGGDLMLVYANRDNPPFDFFADEYRLNAQIERFPKPYVALIDGIVMGGGVGVSFHGSHRVVTENALFAMPEVGIGFFPDVGATYALSRLPDHVGAYLALTGARIGPGDAVALGVASAHVAADRWELLLADLLEGAPVDATLARLGRRLGATLPRQTIATAFAGDSVAAILAALEAGSEGDEAFRAGAATAIRAKSPTSLAIALRQMRVGAGLSMAEALALEYRIVSRICREWDFHEGVRALIIDKDNRPRWRPAAIADVEQSDVDRYFAPLGAGELVLPAPP